MKWLSDVVHRAHARSGHGGVDRSVLREHHDGDFRIHFVNLFEKIETTRGRENQVGDNDVHRISLEAAQGLFDGGGENGFHAAGLGDIGA